MNHPRNPSPLRRFAAGLAAAIGLAASMLSLSPAIASTVTLTGGMTATCTYSNVTGNSAGDFTFTCGSVAPQPGTLSLSASTVSVPMGGSTNVTVIRSSGTSGAVSGNLTVAGAAGCTLSAPSVAFADTSGTASPTTVTVTPSPTATNGQQCTVTLAAAGGALLGTPGALTVTVVDPDAPVSFQFAATTSSASFGGAAVPVVVTRTGGTNGSFDVPITIGGTLTTTPTGPGGALVLGGGTLAPTIIAPNSVLTFPPGSQSVTINYTPPAGPPAGVTSPAGLAFALFGPVVATPGVLPAPVVTQTASLGANTLNSMTVTTPTGCATSASYTVPWINTVIVPSNLKQNETMAISLAIGPTTLGPSATGKFTVSDTVSTGSASDVQVTVSACPGDFSSPQSLAFPCMQHYIYTGGPINFRVTPWPAGTPAWQTFSTCVLPTGTSTVYFNIRQVKKPLSNPTVPSCGPPGFTGTCPFTVQFN
jgi:hypothetical protein